MPKKDSSQDDDLAAKVKAAQSQDSRVTDLEKKVAELTEQLKKASEVASRAQAELQNVKIRLEREAGELRKYASEAVLLKLLPTIDNLQRALKSVPTDIGDNAWVKGIIALEQQFLKEVGDMGLKRFDSVGAKADPRTEEIIMAGPGKEGVVIEMLEDGYTLHDKVIRPAKVKVGDGSVV
jgi:molecular chaperone GrpE